MHKYIDTDELLKQLNACKYSMENPTKRQATYNAAISDVCRSINAIPAADVVEIVRCEYCRWGREAGGNIECFVDSNIPPEYHSYEWFCPNGEKKINDKRK